MDISLFDYELPSELIAQVPTEKRDHSRLLILDRKKQSVVIKPFHSIVSYLKTGDALVVNNTKVFKARLLGKRNTGGKVELFLIRPAEKGQSTLDSSAQINRTRELIWFGLLNPSRRLHEGELIQFGSDSVLLESKLGDGVWRVRFDSLTSMQRIVRAYGHVPLPQYIKRADSPSDIRRYQTVFAKNDRVGAVAAPTAGFHFTKPILSQLKQKGVYVIELTLHVGPGTFKPVTADQIEEHKVDPEFAELSAESAERINQVRQAGGKIVAVGTTSVRTLESARLVNGIIKPFSGMVDLYIRPGYEFKTVDHLVTNFHLPKSSLMILVSAFAQRDRIMSAYERAISEKLRFYSYGDAMLIL